jgi:hypothetical protein
MTTPNPDREIVKEAIQSANPPQWPTLADQAARLDRALDAMANVKHTWVQRGAGSGMMTCVTCKPQHTVFIGIDKRLSGIDDNGKPTFVTVEPRYHEAACSLDL